MIAKSILDTDILSEYLEGHDSAVAGQAARYAAEHGVFTFTSVTVYEIAYGLELKGAYAQLQRAMVWMNQNEAITPAAGDYLAAATIRAKARKQGSILELPDCLIAAVAVRCDLPLVTGNTDDFRAIQGTGAGLKLDNWRNPQSP
ncbi:MAG: PIN domain-containing protein [Bryobacteraceae bacterium]|jgi:predicted nucleic acid-binding protein